MPAAVAATRGTRGRGDAGVLHIDFPGYSGKGSLVAISWDEFFRKFDRARLALVVQDETARGQKSNFNKLVSRASVDQRSVRPPAKRRGAAARTTKRPTARAGAKSAKKKTATSRPKRTTAAVRGKPERVSRGTVKKRATSSRRSTGTRR
jgi:hypothetical protein